MILVKTKLFITDNSGGKVGECIKVLGSKYGNAYLSSLVVVAIKKATFKKKIRVHDVRIGVVVRMKKKTYRPNGISISFGDNAIILIDKRQNPFATRLFGPVASELIRKKYNKIIFMSSSVV